MFIVFLARVFELKIEEDAVGFFLVISTSIVTDSRPFLSVMETSCHRRVADNVEMKCNRDVKRGVGG